jgi:hypothetical protein
MFLRNIGVFLSLHGVKTCIDTVYSSVGKMFFPIMEFNLIYSRKYVELFRINFVLKTDNCNRCKKFLTDAELEGSSTL